MKKAAAILVTSLIVLTACADEQSGEGTEDGIDVAETAPAEGEKRNAKKSAEGNQRSPGAKSSKEASGAGGDAEGGSDREDGGEGRVTTGGGTQKGSGDDPPYPAAGTYTYSQSGYEEFCDSAGNCDKENLPSRQPVTLTFESRKGSSATMITEQKASDSRLARTWTRFTPSGAHITKAYVRFEYSGFSFERTYVPEPAVEALRFPFTSGKSWSGKWKAATSGSYSVTVGKATKTEVGGRGVTAYSIETVTEFRGDFEGKSRVTAYYDPDTKAMVAAEGVLNVTSQFGRYTTVFDMKLLGGPGY